ncbi:MAG: hypothetical protein ACKOCB_00355 [Planctomycetia bacterium]
MSTRAPGRQALVRLGLLLVLAGLWLLPWAEVQDRATGVVRTQVGAERTGLPALAALVLLWSWALAGCVARSRPALRAGEALASGALGCVVTVLLLLGHPWLPGAARAQALLPVFVPLAALGMLEGLLRVAEARGARTGAGTVATLRCAAGVFCASALLANEALAPALLACLLGVGPLAFVAGRDPEAARRSLDGLITLGGLLAGFAPTLQRVLASVPDPVAGLMPSAVGWSVLSALVVLTGATGLFAPREGSAAPTPAAPAS